MSIRTLLLALLVLAAAAGCNTAQPPAAETEATEEPAEAAPPAAEVATFAVPDLDEALGKQLAATVGQDEGVVSAKPEPDKGHFLVTFTPGVASPDAILTLVRSVSPEAQLEGVAAAAGGAAKKGCGGCPSKSKCPKARAAEEAAAAAANEAG